MSLNLGYSFREGLAGFRRARLAVVVSVSTIAITLWVLGVFLVFTVNAQRILTHLKEKMTVEVFIDESLSSEGVRDLEKDIESVPGVQGAVFISKDEALKRFAAEFGEDPEPLLGENPLPASFEVRLTQAYRTPGLTARVVAQLRALKGVEEALYHEKLLATVDRYGRIALIASGILVVIGFFVTVVLIVNTLRLTILSHRQSIQIMSLVGATRGFIRRPYVIQGLLQGLLGGCIASVGVWIVEQIVTHQFPQLALEPDWLVFLPIALGLAIGGVASRIGIRRFLKAEGC
jgi:cell division transport system permease protein